MSPLRIAVVGHTNTGKTSLLRTLARDAGFGEVSDRAGTTRHVEGLRLLADGEAVIELFDTPGMEDAIALLAHLEGLAVAGERIDGPERVARFLAGAEAAGCYEQEAKVLRQLLASDAGLYVVDARDPVLPKHRDELAILAGCARPLLPVLNFVRAPAARPQAWRDALARLGLHAVVSFDTVAPARNGERVLYEALATLLHHGRGPLARLLAAHAREALARQHAARRLGAALLVQLAALRVAVAADEHAIAAATDALQAAVRAREQACVEALLALYRFRADDLSAPALPLVAGRWESDLFNPEALRQLGIRVGGGAAAGAAAGVGVDLLVGGLTLGAAAALGALAGSVLQVAGGYRERLLARVRGQRELTVDDAVLRLLALRLHALIEALEGRGHAALDPIRLADPGARRWREAALPAALRRARSHPEWARGEGQGYDAAVQALAEAEEGAEPR